MTRNIGRLLAALFLVIVAGVVLAGPSTAHVTVSSTDAARGGYGLLTFRVPNESESAATTKLTVQFPTDTPISSMRPQVKPGWEAEVEMVELDEPVKTGEFEITEAVSSVTWTATGDGVPVGAFDTFAVSGGPLPDVDTLTLPAIQEYADGEVAEWNQTATGDEEPEKPAPTVELAAAQEGHHGGSDTSDSEAQEAAEDNDSGGGVDPLSVVALGLAAAALLLSVKNGRSD